MKLSSIELSGVGPFDRVVVPFGEPDAEPRGMTVLLGGGGVGKTTLLSAIASTRPGHAMALGPDAERTWASCSWWLGQDDPSRPHVLEVLSPNVQRPGDADLARRREQARYDRLARDTRSFPFFALGATRWFSRQPLVLSAPARSLARFDPQAPSAFDDGSRADLGRETKQVLAYALLSAAAAAAQGREDRRGERLLTGLQAALAVVLQPVGVRWVGVEPLGFEPEFELADGRTAPFDELPTRVRQLIALIALPARALWAARPELSPVDVEGVIVVDEVEQHQEPALVSRLPSLLRRALPRAQWVLTASSPAIVGGCERGELFTLRREPNQAVRLYTDESAFVH